MAEISLEATLAKPFGELLNNHDRLLLLNQWRRLSLREQSTILGNVNEMVYDEDSCLFAGVDYNTLNPVDPSPYTGQQHLMAIEIKGLLQRKNYRPTSQLLRPQLRLLTDDRQVPE